MPGGNSRLRGAGSEPKFPIMQTRRYFSKFTGLMLAAGAALLFAGAAWAQDTSSVNQAFAVARKSVSPDMQTRVVSVYGLGTPDAIQKWYIIFYDPSVPSHGHAVLVENGQITKSYEAQGGATYSARLTFDPSRITNEEPVLNAAQNYATKHNIAYTSVRALLKQTSLEKPFRWRIELMNADKSEGFVMVNAVDDSVAAYVPHDATTHHESSGSSDGGVAGDAEKFGNDVKNTFLGIGGDLQEFFTGERTVDR
jgi:hypothetical protein